MAVEASVSTPDGSADTSVFDQPRKTARSASGTPSSSQIILIGSGTARASSRSSSACPAIAASRSAQMSSARGRSCSTARGVKALLTSLRSRLCSGGSVLSMWWERDCPNMLSLPCSECRSSSSATRRESFASRGSASAARASA